MLAYWTFDAELTVGSLLALKPATDGPTMAADTDGLHCRLTKTTASVRVYHVCACFPAFSGLAVS